MVTDHAKANEQLTNIARQANIPLPTEPAPDHKAMKAELDKMSGQDFDRAYMQGHFIEHQKAVSSLEYEIGQGQNAELQKFAAETLPTVLSHLDVARRLLGELTLAAAQDAGTAGRGSVQERVNQANRQGAENSSSSHAVRCRP